MAEKKRSGLHKGIESFFSAPGATTATTSKKPEAVMVKLAKIEPNKEQPRKMFDKEALEELAESIRKYGLLQPILVQDRKDRYEIIAGERRWRASKLAGLKEVPVVIRDYSDQEIVELSLIENIQREDLNPIEEAAAYRRLMDEFGLTQEQIAEKVSKNRTTIANSLRLLKLSGEVQSMVTDGRLSPGHARALVTVSGKKQQLALAVKAVEEELSVREIEKLMRDLSGSEKKAGKKEKKKDEALELIYRELEERMKASMGTKVSIRPGNRKHGKIEIEYYNTEDLERIVSLLS